MKKVFVMLLIALTLLAQYALAEGHETVAGTAEKLFSIPAPDAKCTTPQGGCSDGTYYYQAFVYKDKASNEENNVARIVKADLKTGEIVETSGELSLNHCNDMTYHPGLNCLIVCHNNPHRMRLSYVDLETLTVTQTRSIPFSMFSVCYNANRDQYVIGLSGGQEFTILNANLKLADKSGYNPTPLTKGYTTQGNACDDDYIYFVLYRENVITVYNWEGEFVRLIEMKGTGGEPENIDIVNGEIYVSFATVNAVEIRKIHLQ